MDNGQNKRQKDDKDAKDLKDANNGLSRTPIIKMTLLFFVYCWGP